MKPRLLLALLCLLESFEVLLIAGISVNLSNQEKKPKKSLFCDKYLKFLFDSWTIWKYFTLLPVIDIPFAFKYFHGCQINTLYYAMQICFCLSIIYLTSIFCLRFIGQALLNSHVLSVWSNLEHRTFPRFHTKLCQERSVKACCPAQFTKLLLASLIFSV